MLNGGCICVVDRDTLLAPASFGQFLQRRQITTLFLTTALFNQVASEAVEALAGLDYLMFGGEIVEPSRVASVLARTKPRHLLHVYGPTETTTFAAAYEIVAVPEGARTIPIGRPIANTRIYILDEHGEPVPMGVAGELYIGGAGVARGYLNRPELTEQRFVPSPFVAGDRLYKTGDLGRYLPDGSIEFLGRNDSQVKLRGFRVELGEIEVALAQHAGVAQAAVMLREDEGEKRLVAYYTPADGADALSIEAVRVHLADRLPDYMLPSAYVQLEALPLTPNGKVDRRALPAPDGSAYVHQVYEAPQTQTELLLAGIWSEMLGVAQVSRHDNFFELGGHSLLAVRMIERMREAGLHADVRTIFTAPTLAALAAAIGSESALVAVPPNGIPADCELITPEMLPLVQLTSTQIEGIVETVPGGASNVADIYPLAPLQEGILFHHLLGGSGDPYLVRSVLRFDSRARVDRFIDALQAAIDRHDVLRTAVVWEGLPEPVQVVWRTAPVIVQECAVDSGTADVAEELAARFDPRQYRIDVRQAPLMRVAIARDGVTDRWVMVLLMHHLLWDHTALEFVLGEVQAHLAGQAAELPAPLPFRNFVAQARLGVSREEHEAFFRALLGDVDEPTMPFGLLDVQGDGVGIVEGRCRSMRCSPHGCVQVRANSE